MIVPGSNLFRIAGRVIRYQKVIYYEYLRSDTDAVGQLISVFKDPVDIKGSFQPVKRSLYQQNGLNFAKDYANFYSDNNLLGVDRDYSGDEVVFNGARFKIESNTPWYKLDGWNACLLVNIGYE